MSSDQANFKRRIEEAINDYQDRAYSSVRTTAAAYKLSKTTLRARINRRQPRAIAHESQQRLTPYQKKALAEWIIKQEAQG